MSAAASCGASAAVGAAAAAVCGSAEKRELHAVSYSRASK
jgi:hypothetical protein